MEFNMTKLRITQMFAAALLLGSPAFAGQIGNSNSPAGSTNMAQTKSPDVAVAAESGGKTSGPAAGTNVKPSTGPATGGNPGQPGMPGNKSGPPAKPSDQKTK
jgi:hypothetical protein